MSAHAEPDGSDDKSLLAMIQNALSWAYGAALDGVPGMGTLEELVDSYLQPGVDPEDAIDSLIAWQIGKAGTAGFLTGLGGIITLPAAIPANLATVLFIQLRMIAGIAKIRGYDVRSDQVKTLCFVCLAGNAAADILKDVGIQVGVKLGQQAIGRIAGATLVRINQAVGFRLVTKAGSTGIVNLSKMVPFLGGIIGGTFDAVATKVIGSTAKGVFTALGPSSTEVVSAAEGGDT